MTQIDTRTEVDFIFGEIMYGRRELKANIKYTFTVDTEDNQVFRTISAIEVNCMFTPLQWREQIVESVELHAYENGYVPRFTVERPIEIVSLMENKNTVLPKM